MNISEKMPIEDLLAIVFDENDEYGWSSKSEACNAIIRKFNATQHMPVGGRFKLVLIFDESEVEETGVCEYRVKGEILLLTGQIKTCVLLTGKQNGFKI